MVSKDETKEITIKRKSGYHTPLPVVCKNNSVENTHLSDQYQPYKKIDADWLKKGRILVRKKDGEACRIIGLYPHNKIGVSSLKFPTMGVVVTLKDAYKKYNWLQLGTPFGEKIEVGDSESTR